LLRINPYGRRPSQERNSEHGERTLRSTGPLIMAPDAAEEGMTRRVEARAGLIVVCCAGERVAGCWGAPPTFQCYLVFRS
jgi:hypothetical protein